ncbi:MULTISPECIES: hypothetical protein [unclassified Nocardiopsis]|uniref:hypothetical protein n=1 Tax=unclassified Nocardiopsis TaxID=2649073 RepID=UPI001357994D|nr:MULTISPECIES: hypothetical protein [unclassified Nocardiopsis]
MSAVTHARIQAAVMAVAPAVLLATFLYHPHLEGRMPDPDVVTAAAEADPAHWGAVHLLTVWAFALLVLAFLALRARMRDAGENRWSAAAFPLVVLSGVLTGAVAALELAVSAAATAGLDVRALVEAVDPWFQSLLMSGSVAFLLGALAFAVGVARARLLGPAMTVLVVAALVVMALSRMVPVFSAFYVGSAAAVLVFWPVAAAALRRGGGTAAPRPRTAPDASGRPAGRRAAHVHR